MSRDTEYSVRLLFSEVCKFCRVFPFHGGRELGSNKVLYRLSEGVLLWEYYGIFQAFGSKIRVGYVLFESVSGGVGGLSSTIEGGQGFGVKGRDVASETTRDRWKSMGILRLRLRQGSVFPFNPRKNPSRYIFCSTVPPFGPFWANMGTFYTIAVHSFAQHTHGWELTHSRFHRE